MDSALQVRDCILGHLELGGIDEAPGPFFAALERRDDGMVCVVEVSGRVAIWRAVAAADVTAGQAETKMHPAGTGGEALFAALWCAWRKRRDLGDMMTAHVLILDRPKREWDYC